MRNAPALLLPLLLASAACVAAPPGPPDAVAQALLVELDAGRSAQADELFESVRRDAVYTEEIYPVLFERARRRYGEGDFAGAADVLRFLSRHYGEAKAVREALLYALFLERASSPEPDPARARELDAVVADLQARDAKTPWLDLVVAQQRIDQGRLPEAREAFQRFVPNGPPLTPELALYVENVDRYLRSHGGPR